MVRPDAAKGQWVPKPAVAGAPARPDGGQAQGPSEDASYTRCVLLELSPLCGMAASPSASKKIDMVAASSPWIVPGSLYCVRSDLVPDEEPEAEAPARPRAASDHVRPGKSTTLILKNIPRKYGRTGLCEELAANGFGYAIDFLYLPIDSATGENLGHAFVNVRTKDATRDFVTTFQDAPVRDRLKTFAGEGILQVACSDVQGREANMRKLCTSANLKSWLGHEEREPLFLDDFGIRIPLEPPPDAAGPPGHQTSGQDAPPDGLAVSQRPRQCVSAKTTPLLAPGPSPVLCAIAAPPGLPPPQELDCKGLERAPSEPSSDGTTACSGVCELKASAPEFVPRYMSSPPMRPEAEEFVPFEPMMVLLPEAAELAD